MFAALLLHTFAFSAVPATNATCDYLTVTAANNGPTCYGAPVTLTATTNATNPSFHWQCLKCGGPAPGVNYDVQTLTVSNTGSTWEVIVTDSSTGCSTSAQTVPQFDPAPRIAAPLTWCASQGDIVVTIGNDDPTNPFSNITWSVRHGEITSGQGTKTITVHPDVQYPTPVDVAYDIAATNARGCSFPATGYFDTSTNVRPEQPLFDLQAPSSGCRGGVYQATLVPTTSINSLQWSATNATLVFCQQPYTTACFHPDGAGPVTISATYTTTGVPDCPRTVSRTMQVGRTPSATFDAGVITTCSGTDAVIPITLSGTPPFSIRWSDGLTQDGISGSTTARTVRPQTDTDFTIESVSDSSCTNATPSTVSVHVAEPPLIVSEPESAIVAPNASATLRVESNPGDVRFQWYEGASGDTSHPVGTMSSTFTTPPLTKPASYWVRVMNNCGFSDSATATVMPSSAVRHRPARH
jgi:hypothetical protein